MKHIIGWGIVLGLILAMLHGTADDEPVAREPVRVEVSGPVG